MHPHVWEVFNIWWHSLSETLMSVTWPTSTNPLSSAFKFWRLLLFGSVALVDGKADANQIRVLFEPIPAPPARRPLWVTIFHLAKECMECSWKAAVEVFHCSIRCSLMLLLWCRSVSESFLWGASRHLQLWLNRATQLLPQCYQVSTSCHCPAAEPSLPESQVIYCSLNDVFLYCVEILQWLKYICLYSHRQITVVLNGFLNLSLAACQL